MSWSCCTTKFRSTHWLVPNICTCMRIRYECLWSVECWWTVHYNEAIEVCSRLKPEHINTTKGYESMQLINTGSLAENISQASSSVSLAWWWCNELMQAPSRVDSYYNVILTYVLYLCNWSAWVCACMQAVWGVCMCVCTLALHHQHHPATTPLGASVLAVRQDDHHSHWWLSRPVDWVHWRQL